MSEPTKKIIHVDMDAFYASVEQRDDPSLRGRPVVVGGNPNGRGVVAAASYEARQYGIHSAMPAARAARLCPSLVFAPHRFDVYREVSAQMHAILHDYTDAIEPLSLDECYLDVTENKVGEASATRIAQAIRERVRDELRLTCSAGVAPLKFVAKIASDYRKPDGLTVVPPDQVLAFIHPLPVRKLWGVGPATEQRLHARGIRTIAQLAALPDDVVHKSRHLRYLHRMANGNDPRPVRTSRTRRSRSSERTFAEDITDKSELRDSLVKQAERVCQGLSKRSLRGRTVTMKLRYGDFTTITRSLTLDDATASPDLVCDAAFELLDRTEAGERPVRLIGVGLANLVRPGDPEQLNLPLGTTLSGV